MEKPLKKIFEWHPYAIITLPISLSIGLIVGLTLWCGNLLTRMLNSKHAGFRFAGWVIAIALLLYAFISFAARKAGFNSIEKANPVEVVGSLILGALFLVLLAGLILYLNKMFWNFIDRLLEKHGRWLGWLFIIVAYFAVSSILFTTLVLFGAI